ncbi:MAG: 4Fe-4S binding protein [Saprospiraceae bacterium]|nr:4Fe-4S binding protein [Saprospiraceae bacterium]
MSHNKRNKLVFTLKDRCRVCYTCVRECPVKAIKIINGQAEVINERCIGCGNCVKVCSQGAKIFLDSTSEVMQMIDSGEKVIACVAPSFPAEFKEISDYKVVVGMIKALGFDKVVEVSFGADIVAKEYRKLLDDEKGKACISSDCPAIVYYVEHYYPHLVDFLAPIASPMVAITRIVKEKYGADNKVVFIGPCIAKKAESDEIDEAITFKELRKLFLEKNIKAEKVKPREFDPPFSGKGSIFPISRGLLQTTEKTDDLIKGNIIVADGKEDFKEAIKEFDSGDLKNHHLELLCCDGCIMGPGMSSDGARFEKRTKIKNYVKDKIENLDKIKWDNEIDEFKHIDFSQHFSQQDRRIEKPTKKEIDKVLKKMGKTSITDHLNCGACGYATCEEHAIAIVEGLAETEMCLPYSIEKLHNSISDLNISNEKLANAQMALRQSEKLAHMGQLSAGIAHELNNPLGVITMYSNILLDEMPESNPTREDLKLIVEQTERCKKIVGGLLNFARKNQVKLEKTNIAEFVEHSISSIIKADNIIVKFNSNLTNTNLLIDQNQMMQVLTNLEKNAVDAMPKGGVLSIFLEENNGSVEINIQDTGIGISEENMEKIFTPFFTTKEAGKGTGLGLPLIYGIVKMHNGQINVKSNANPKKGPTGTNFKIVLAQNI